jgi:Protein of unknown function (DUF669)
MTNTQLPQMPLPGGIPGIPQMTNVIPAPTGGGMQTEPETYNWAQWLAESNIQEQAMPSADYDAQIVAAEPDRASTGNPMFRVTWQIISGPYAGRRLSRNIVVAHEKQKAMRVFFRQMKALGFEDQFWLGNPTPSQVAEAMLNRMARIQVKQREFPPNTGVIDNEVGFIREAINSPMQAAPAMINQSGYPAAPPMPQFVQPPQTYAAQPQAPQQPQQPPPTVVGQVPPGGWQGPQQPAQPQQYPLPGQQPQLQPTQNIPVGPEHAQMPPTWQQTIPQQAPPQTPQFEQMLRPPEAPQQAAPPPPPPPQPMPGPEAQQPPQPTPEQIQQYLAALQAQQSAQQPAATQPLPPPPPVPREF